MHGQSLPEDLLHLAEGDYATAEKMRVTGIFEDRIFGFHAQQAAEKALKAWIRTCHAEYRLTHDLRDLLQTLDILEQGVEEYWPLTTLSRYAVQFRYERFDQADEFIDRDWAIALLASLLCNVRLRVLEQ